MFFPKTQQNDLRKTKHPIVSGSKLQIVARESFRPLEKILQVKQKRRQSYKGKLQLLCRSPYKNLDAKEFDAKE